jgi:amidohydrolase
VGGEHVAVANGNKPDSSSVDIMFLSSSLHHHLRRSAKHISRSSNQYLIKNNYNNSHQMRLLPCLTLSLAYFSSGGVNVGVNGLPSFGVRGVKDEEGESGGEAVADAYVSATGGEIIQVEVSTTEGNGVRRNPIVESYFASSDQQELKSAGHNTRDDLVDEIHTRAANLTDFLVATRRTLHAHPELMYNEAETSAVVQARLREMDISFSTGWAHNKNPEIHPGKGGYGIVADIGTGGPPCVLLRADMDALPIFERTVGVDDFKSKIDGNMHACGHDGHTTMLLGAAKILKSMEHSLNGTVRLMFQPAEEGGAGGKRMREEGVLEVLPKPQYAFGMHVWPNFPSGAIAGRPGPLLAACERFEILVSGVGGHAAMPHQTIDPIVTASAIVMNLQTIVSRTLSPLESGVCSITKIEAGDAFNIIPAAAIMRGTVRALSTETLLLLRDRVEHIVQHTAATHGCNVTVTFSPDYYPPTVNDPVLYETFAKAVGGLVSEEGYVRDTEPTMGAEDFSFLAETIPSAFFFLGQGSGVDPPTNYGLHHPHFALDESVMPRGVELHVNLALRALRKLQQGEPVVAAA